MHQPLPTSPFLPSLTVHNLILISWSPSYMLSHSEIKQRDISHVILEKKEKVLSFLNWYQNFVLVRLHRTLPQQSPLTRRLGAILKLWSLTKSLRWKSLQKLYIDATYGSGIASVCQNIKWVTEWWGVNSFSINSSSFCLNFAAILSQLRAAHGFNKRKSAITRWASNNYKGSGTSSHYLMRIVSNISLDLH